MKSTRYAKLGALAALGIIAACGTWLGIREYLSLKRFPTLSELKGTVRTSDVLVVDRAGKPLHELRHETRLRRLHWVPLAKMAPELVEYVVAFEDKRFYSHGGVDAKAIAGAARDRVKRGRVRTPFTISMRTVGFLQNRNEGPGLGSAFKLAVGAFHLEREWMKDEILEAYLNLVTFRGSLVGIEAASREIFRKDPHALTNLESAILAALVRAPDAPAAVVVRRACAAHDILHSEDDPTALASACAQIGEITRAVLRAPETVEPALALAPHVVNMLVARAETLKLAGQPWRTTLDRDLQRMATQLLERYQAGAPGAPGAPGAILVMENRTGDILAYVADGKTDWVKARREVGRMLVPFFYGLAFERRLFTPVDLRADIPFALAPEERVRRYFGEGVVLAKLADFGFSSAALPDARLAGFDASLGELTNAYRALATSGVYSEPHLLLDRGEERVLFRAATAGDSSALLARNAFSQGVSFWVSDFLAARGSGSERDFGADREPRANVWSAVKTHSASDDSEHWAVGSSSRYTVGVWLTGAAGAPAANAIWSDLLNHLHAPDLTLAKAPPPAPLKAEAAKVEAVSALSPVAVPAAPATAAANTAATSAAATATTATVKKVETDTATVRSLATRRPPGPRANPALPKIAWKKIVYPRDGEVISLAGRGLAGNANGNAGASGKVRFRMQPEDPSLVWYLNGKRLGVTSVLSDWQPRPGNWRLTLREESGKLVDEILFEVK